MSASPNVAVGARYRFGDELASSVIHGIGIVLSIIGLTTLVAFAAQRGDARVVIASAVYGTTLVLLYTASTLYHSISVVAAKPALRTLDHIAIFLLIAGTYTPFLMVGLASPLAKGLMIVIWGMALVGVMFKLVFAHRFEVISLITYLTMGWLSLVVIYQLAQRLPLGGMILLAVGGLIYTVGVIFYACHRIPFNHAIWHGFVLGGCVCHFLAIYLYI